ncbi:MAG: ATP-binding protein [Cyanothece sp. SIO2G6]|nr:ATP-binding protein [Cyanothece sp. SIO2G6]
MKVSIKNLGILEHAEFTLGDLTVICGQNNTGKTYATYALFGFLYIWREVFSISIDDKKIDQLLTDGSLHLDLQEYVKQSKEIIRRGCQAYTRQLSKIFAAPSDRFDSTSFIVEVDTGDIQLEKEFDREISTARSELLSITKEEKIAELIITLLTEKENVKIPKHILGSIISDAIKDVVFTQFFPNPFIASAERTGAAIFRKELNFARNRLLEEISQTGKNIDPIELLLTGYQDYALPVKNNVDFTRQLESVVKKNSFIAESHPDVLEDFADIIGGSYVVTRDDELYYTPRKSKRLRLSMEESSSAVRSLLDIGFYLRHEARMGDLLIVDEPELNLHPENQRRVARLFTRLVNLGIKVFITTHSDYIIKELNTLIMLNHDKPHLKRIAEEESYRNEELITAERIKVYIAEQALIKLEGKSRRTKCQTLTPADIDPKLGIEARSFDITIEKMNQIQERIVWGED